MIGKMATTGQALLDDVLAIKKDAAMTLVKVTSPGRKYPYFCSGPESSSSSA